MKTIFTAVQAFIADEDGVTAIEYGLIAALVGVAMAGAAKLLVSRSTRHSIAC